MGRRDKEIIENVYIESVAAEGNALAHVNGKALFVPLAIPGDVVDVQITHKRSAYMQGYVKRTVTPSPLRVAPFCAHFGDCGGCKWQPLPYSKQLEFKQQQVVDQLTRIGKLALPEISPILASEQTVGYRNKLEFTFSNHGWVAHPAWKEALPEGTSEGARACAPVFIETPPALGFHVSGRFDKVLDINECHLQAAPSNALRNALRAFALQEQLAFFDLRAQTGFLRNVMIRTASTGEVMVVVVFAHVDESHPKANTAMRCKVLDYLYDRFPEITSLQYIINTKKNDNFLDLPVVPYKGRSYITERMEGLQFKIGPKSFYQTNSAQAYRLYSVVRDFAALDGSQRVYDLYTGTGTIALFLSGLCKEVIGVEYVQEAIDHARENAAFNGISNVRFFAGDMKDVLTPEFVAAQGTPDVLVLDPPRAGVHPSVLQVILQAAPAKIVYVSCNPATQARDLQTLSLRYSIEAVQPVDMFPHTHHVENVVLLKRLEA